MGWETVAMLGIKAFTASQEISQGKKEAKALVEQGNIASENSAQATQRKAATQTVSFLNSGLMLEGTPKNVISATFTAGLKDLGQIRSNYNNAAKNAITAARTKALEGLASGFTSAFGSIGGTTGPLDALGKSTGTILNGGASGDIPFGSTDLGDSMPWQVPNLIDTTPQLQLPSFSQ